ncbi:MAG TPA: alkaline phosphatase family protein [Thermoanaerobaculia bacterium]|jgi:phospholipase C
MTAAQFAFVFDWQPENGSYRVWRFDPESGNPLPAPLVQTGRWEIDEGHQLMQLGNYLLDWVAQDGSYRLWSLDLMSGEPLSFQPAKTGSLGAIQEIHQLVPLGNYALDWTPQDGSYSLLAFDPKSSEPLSVGPPANHDTSRKTIGPNHQLVPLGNYVLDWVPESGDYSLWSFDPQTSDPLPGPPVRTGTWSAIGPGHQLVPIGDYVLDWVPQSGAYNLWKFDPQSSDPLSGPLQTGTWSAIGPRDVLVGLLPVIPVQTSAPAPGTLDFMRSKIKHVVYYMLENRSFDHVCGWLYENGVPAQIIGADQGPFKGASSDDFNCDRNGRKYPITKHPPHDQLCPTVNTHHGHGDVMAQLFDDPTRYGPFRTPPMTGFVLNNETGQAMDTYTPEGLPILNGLAKSFAVSDEWFCSLPGPTDVNRAFSLTGSSFGRTGNFREEPVYGKWPDTRHRPSIWQVLWGNGFEDWKIYHQANWGEPGAYFCYTYHVFLQGQIPSFAEGSSPHVAGYDQFLADIAGGSLPRFSFLEPSWIGGNPLDPNRQPNPNTYHPTDDLAPGEVTLNDMYNALLNGPRWDETLLIVTFDEHGGLYDHVPPPYGARPFAGDATPDGFQFDLFGVRVPTILVSPWVEERTVFRSPTSVAYDSTSMPATVLSWYGVPRERWGLGERIAHAPTFEGALTRATPRADKPAFTPLISEPPLNEDIPLNDLHREFVPRIVWHLGHGKLSDAELRQATRDILSRAGNVAELHALLLELDITIARA